MSDDIDVLKPETILKPKIEQPRLYKVVLLNDDYTPREFVVQVLKAVFRTTEDQAYRIMMTAHQRGVCVVATFTRDIAESKAKEAHRHGPPEGLSARLLDRAGGIARTISWQTSLCTGPSCCRSAPRVARRLPMCSRRRHADP